MDQSERDEIMSALAEMGGKLQRAFAENDADLYLSAFSEEAIVSWPAARPVRGHDELREQFKNRPAIPEGASMKIEPLEIEILSSDWAYAFGADILEFGDGSRATLTFIALVGKTANGWKTFREVVSADQP